MNNKRAVILCDGEPPLKSLLSEEILASEMFIAADGGAQTAIQFDIMPDIIIGDMDSFTEYEGHSHLVIKDDDQETNDLEKALNYALGNDITQIAVLGATGKRIDHTLKNISVLKQFTPKFSSIYFKDTYGIYFMLPKEYTIYEPVGTVVSLFPLSGLVTGIRTTGLKYALNKESLENGVRDGSSNEISHYPAKIIHEDGDLLIFIGRPKI